MSQNIFKTNEYNSLHGLTNLSMDTSDVNNLSWKLIYSSSLILIDCFIAHTNN